MDGALESLILLAIPIIFLVLLISAAVKVVQEYERGVIFRLGRLIGAKGPGLFFIIPIIDRMIKVDLRVVTLDIPAQDCISNDNVTIKVNAVAYYRVVDPERSVVAASTVGTAPRPRSHAMSLWAIRPPTGAASSATTATPQSPATRSPATRQTTGAASTATMPPPP